MYIICKKNSCKAYNSKMTICMTGQNLANIKEVALRTYLEYIYEEKNL